VPVKTPGGPGVRVKTGDGVKPEGGLKVLPSGPVGAGVGKVLQSGTKQHGSLGLAISLHVGGSLSKDGHLSVHV